MNKNFDSRQTEHRSELKRLSKAEKPTLKQILPQVDAELTPVFELRASATPDLTLNIGAGSIVNSDTGLTRAFSPIDGQFFNYTSGTIVFPAANGGTITIANGIDSALVMADDTFMAVLAQINSIGEVSVSQGLAVAAEADTLLAVNFPVPNDGELPIGYVVLQNIAGVIQPIANEKIVQFESGGGGSGTGDAVQFLSEMDDYLDDSFFEYYAPIIFPRDKEVFINDVLSTGDFKNADGIYQLEPTQILETKNLFDTEFVARALKSLQKDLVVDYFDDASRDDAATYELSIDGGVTFEAITMTRQEGTTRYTGRILLSDNATFNDLRLRITASEVETKIENIAVFYNETLGDSGVSSIKNSQTFNINGSDNVTGFTLTNFLPDPTLLRMFVEETGQTFIGSALSVNGFVVSVPSGTFDAPGEQYTITIQQLVGSSFDNSDANSNKIANLEASIRDFGKQASGDSLESIMIDAPNTSITNRAKIPTGAKASFGVDRLMVTKMIRENEEYGPQGQEIFSCNHSNIRFGGVVSITSDTSLNGRHVTFTDGAFNNARDFVEVTFFGTALNLIYAGSNVATDDINAEIIVDGVSQGTSNIGDVAIPIRGRNYASNVVTNIVKDLALDFHTVVIRGAAGSQDFLKLYGFEVVNASSQISIPAGNAFAGILKQTNPNTALEDFKPAGMGTNGGRVIKYVVDGQINDAYTEVATPGFLSAANHSNEEAFRTIHFREFGSANNNDFQTLSSGSSNRTFTLGDGTTTLLGSGVSHNVGVFPEGFYLFTSGSFFILTFVGTGLDIVMRPESATGTIGTIPVQVDNISVGNLSTLPGGNSVVRIASNLPYGTHTVKITRTAVSTNNGDPSFKEFIVYQPKKPEAPQNAAILCDYNVLADYDSSNTTSGALDGSIQRPKGVLLKQSARELKYQQGNWSVASINTQNRLNGLNLFSNSANPKITYEFFGTGLQVLLLGSTLGTIDYTIKINGVLNDSGVALVNGTNLGGGSYRVTTSGTYGIPHRVELTGLALGLYTVEIEKVAGSGSMNSAALEIITPIHITKNSTIGNQSLRSSDFIKNIVKKDNSLNSAKAWFSYNTGDGSIIDSYNVEWVIEVVGNEIMKFGFKTPFKNSPVSLLSASVATSPYIRIYGGDTGTGNAAIPVDTYGGFLHIANPNTVGVVYCVFFGELQNEEDIDLGDL